MRAPLLKRQADARKPMDDKMEKQQMGLAGLSEVSLRTPMSKVAQTLLLSGSRL